MAQQRQVLSKSGQYPPQMAGRVRPYRPFLDANAKCALITVDYVAFVQPSLGQREILEFCWCFCGRFIAIGITHNRRNIILVHLSRILDLVFFRLVVFGVLQSILHLGLQFRFLRPANSYWAFRCCLCGQWLILFFCCLCPCTTMLFICLSRPRSFERLP